MGNYRDRIAREITEQVTRTNRRPLPLYSSWVVGKTGRTEEWRPERQLEEIGKGHHILPVFQLPIPGSGDFTSSAAAFTNYYSAALQTCADLNLPICLVSTQWEQALYAEEPYASLGTADTARTVLAAGGALQNQVSPFGNSNAWSARGQQITSSGDFSALAVIYPNPPLVVMTSNNEAAKLAWPDAEKDQLYLDAHGSGHGDESVRGFFNDGWQAMYGALFGGMEDNLPSAWQGKSRVIGYQAFADSEIGRHSGWRTFASQTSAEVSWQASVWDGGSPSYYLHDTSPISDDTAWSPQIEAMNEVFMLDLFLEINPDFWFEYSVWDGHNGAGTDKRENFISAGQVYTPERYVGWAKFGMWMNRPRVMRMFESSSSIAGVSADKYFEYDDDYRYALMSAIDDVHTTPVLRRFWEDGELVPHPTQGHLYNVDFPSEYSSYNRWFQLDCTNNPAYDWSVGTIVTSFCAARVRGASPTREWLVFGHSPLGLAQSVGITIPSAGGTFATFTADIAVVGNYYHVVESAGTISSISEIT